MCPLRYRRNALTELLHVGKRWILLDPSKCARVLAILPIIVAPSKLLAFLCYLYLTLMFISTSHKHCTFTTSYVFLGSLSLIANYAMLIRPKKAETAAQQIFVMRAANETLDSDAMNKFPERRCSLRIVLGSLSDTETARIFRKMNSSGWLLIVQSRPRLNCMCGTFLVPLLVLIAAYLKL